MTIRRLKRPKLGARKLDMTPIREALKDRRQWTALGVVTVPDGESSHYQLVEDGGTLVDILVDVLLQPDGIDVTCRLAGGAGSQGMWVIPAEGDEVIVVMPSGRYDFMPTIVGQVSSREISNPSGEGPAPSRTVIVNGEVLIHDGSGGTDQLVKKTAFAAHVHPTGVGPSGVPDNAAASTTYTEVLKAK